MFDASARAMRRVVAVCLGVSCVAVISSAGAGNPREAEAAASRETSARAEPLRIPGEGPGAITFAYRPRDASAPRPAVVYLNGRCGVTTNGCPHFREGAEPFGWLVCPPANVACPGGGASWGGSPSDRRDLVANAVSDVARAFPGEVDASAPTVLVGFSQGAWIALDLARQTPSRYRGLLLIGADVEPRPADLRAAGVVRIALAAGAYDMAAAPMAQKAKALAAAGVDARWVSLGTVGHTYVADADHAGAITAALAWLEGSGDAT
jgi:predicted esterase